MDQLHPWNDLLMKCYVEIIDGKVSGYPMCSPMIESEFKKAFPNVNIDNLPAWIVVSEVAKNIDE
jgi:hypothetical protein